MSNPNENDKAHAMRKTFRPANGTEGEMFMERNCFRCKHYDPEHGIDCEILLATLIYDVDDPRYPTEWTAEDVQQPHTWSCSKFERRQ